MDWSRRVGSIRSHLDCREACFEALPSGLKSKLETSSRFGNVDFDRTIALSDEMNYAATIRLNIDMVHRSDLNKDCGSSAGFVVG